MSILTFIITINLNYFRIIVWIIIKFHIFLLKARLVMLSAFLQDWRICNSLDLRIWIHYLMLLNQLFIIKYFTCWIIKPYLFYFLYYFLLFYFFLTWGLILRYFLNWDLKLFIFLIFIIRNHYLNLFGRTNWHFHWFPWLSLFCLRTRLRFIM